MPFIKSQPTIHKAGSIEAPPMPALQSIFYWLAVIIIFLAIASWKLIDQPEGISTETFLMGRIFSTAAALFTSLIFFGIGQVIGYLGQTAYYTQKILEKLETAQSELDQ